jgi:N-acyl-D-amino-acid deacylase
MPAARLKLADRGQLKEGLKADLVLFDPKTVVDRSTFDQPRALASGIATVWVNGTVVWNGSSASGRFPGRVLTPR